MKRQRIVTMEDIKNARRAMNPNATVSIDGGPKMPIEISRVDGPLTGIPWLTEAELQSFVGRTKKEMFIHLRHRTREEGKNGIRSSYDAAWEYVEYLKQHPPQDWAYLVTVQDLQGEPLPVQNINDKLITMLELSLHAQLAVEAWYAYPFLETECKEYLGEYFQKKDLAYRFNDRWNRYKTGIPSPHVIEGDIFVCIPPRIRIKWAGVPP